MDVIASSVYNIALYFYNALYICMEAWCYHGPRWMPGFYDNAGKPESDISAKLIGISSNLFEGNGFHVQDVHSSNHYRTLFLHMFDSGLFVLQIRIGANI